MKNIGERLWNALNSFLKFMAFRVLHLKITEENWEKFLQFVKFGIVGLSNTVISYVIYVSALVLFQKENVFPRIDYLIAHVIAFALSVLWSFYWNRKYVFDADNEQIIWWKALIKTYVSYAFTGLFLNTILSILWVDVLHISKFIAPIINLLASVPLNFILNKFWAFKK